MGFADRVILFPNNQYYIKTKHNSVLLLKRESVFIHNVVTKFYQHILALVFAIEEINWNPNILPNVTLGFHIYDSYIDKRWTYRTTLDLLFQSVGFYPNFKCGIQKYVVGIIGGLSFETSSYLADILSLYKIPQVWSMYGECMMVF